MQPGKQGIIEQQGLKASRERSQASNESPVRVFAGNSTQKALSDKVRRSHWLALGSSAAVPPGMIRSCLSLRSAVRPWAPVGSSGLQRVVSRTGTLSLWALFRSVFERPLFLAT